jgi:uncharacterized protein (DUF1778 family)
MASVRKGRVEIRLKESEKACLAKLADGQDLTISDYIRKTSLKKCCKK